MLFHYTLYIYVDSVWLYNCKQKVSTEYDCTSELTVWNVGKNMQGGAVGPSVRGMTNEEGVAMEFAEETTQAHELQSWHG